MIASELISEIVAPLTENDTGEEALTIMHVYHVKHLPIVKGDKYIAMLSEEDILNSIVENKIGTYSLRKTDTYAKMNEHLFDVMSSMAKSRLTTIPVIDEHDIYQGMILQEDLIQFYANSFSFAEPGSIIVLETIKSNYSLAQIAHVIESEGTTLLSSFITSDPESNTIYVTLKLNKREVENIVATLERYEYTIKASFVDEEKTEGLKDRYDSLMRYLNV